MKTLLFLLISISCFASGQNNDSLKIKLSELEQKNIKIETQMKKLDLAEKRHESAFFRLKLFIKSLMNEKTTVKNDVYSNGNREAIKVENVTDPVTEIQIPDGVDSIRGGWLYRFFHRDNYIRKPFKIINNEKIYLD